MKTVDKISMLDQVALDSLVAPNLYGNNSEPLYPYNESLNEVFLDLAADADLNPVFPAELNDQFARDYLSDL
ncbi:hypothetical protein [Candidatus Epulonipiscium viviparus]|uniref:hypothetical protein n=1 Tax=Candidatus Epulonipiscium viviparus TaxID=420336 RepID=UPI0027380C2B|nr:hypothetical protein [Candidatus Epulopiscium viviparus]